jgi:hypothetical protein
VKNIVPNKEKVAWVGAGSAGGRYYIMRILKICPFLGILSRRKYLNLSESFTVNRLTLVVAPSIANKMRNYSDIQLRATLTHM